MLIMTSKVLRIALIVLAFAALIIFIAEIKSPRNDATHIAQAVVVIALLATGFGWWKKKSTPPTE
jgi:hypothetical protein